ncbi:MAG: methyltransferase domain-containing protein [Planctomycetes bacterium]|nr:methyltransferase domain-containing protein [Planctomycetota bacterium]
MPEGKRPPVIDYEGSDYQTRFWETGGRDYEDRCEAIALKRLLPQSGKLMLELGAGAGRNTPRYQGFERVILLDFSRTQLKQAQERLGTSERYIYVAADIYRLPFVDSLFDVTTMIRTLHHMADAPAALRQVRNVLKPGATFILEYANKRNLKAILRYALRLQTWNPFGLEPVEFAPLNFDFHPRAVCGWLRECGFRIEKTLTVSHFRIGILKQTVPTGLLVLMDSILQWTGALVRLSPSIFLEARVIGSGNSAGRSGDITSYFKCPECGQSPLINDVQQMVCPSCGRKWKLSNGIYDFRGDEL